MMNKNIIIIISILIVIGGTLSIGFILFVDLASKIATVLVLFWAVHTYSDQRQFMMQSKKNQRLKDLSFRLIDYVGNSTFSLNKNSANILITYLEAVKEEASESVTTSEQIKEYKLALNFTLQSLMPTTLMDVLSLESISDYDEVINVLTMIYSDSDKLREFDLWFYRRLQESPRSSALHGINVPSGLICLWQIKKIMALLLEVEESEIHKELSRGRQSMFDRHHHFPVLYALYYFYTHGGTFVEENGDYDFSIDKPRYIRPYKRPDVIPTNQAG